VLEALALHASGQEALALHASGQEAGLFPDYMGRLVDAFHERVSEEGNETDAVFVLVALIEGA